MAGSRYVVLECGKRVRTSKRPLRKGGECKGSGKYPRMMTVMAGSQYIVLGYGKHSRERCRTLRKNGAGTHRDSHTP